MRIHANIQDARSIQGPGILEARYIYKTRAQLAELQLVNRPVDGKFLWHSQRTGFLQICDGIQPRLEGGPISELPLPCWYQIQGFPTIAIRPVVMEIDFKDLYPILQIVQVNFLNATASGSWKVTQYIGLVGATLRTRWKLMLSNGISWSSKAHTFAWTR